MAERKFLIDKVNGLVHLDDKTLSFDEFFQGGIDGKSAYDIWRETTGNENKTVDEYIEYLKGVNGEAAINVIIESTGGNFFKRNDPATTLTAVVAIGGSFMNEIEANNLRYEWRCNGVEILVNNDNMEHIGLYNGSDVPYGTRLTRDIDGSDTLQVARNIIVGTEDVDNKAQYTCNIFKI